MLRRSRSSSLDLSARRYGRHVTRKKREAAATALAVDLAVLDWLGELTAREDPKHGRKYGGQRPSQGNTPKPTGPLTPEEVSWLESVTPRLIRREAEHDARGGSEGLPRITMAEVH